MFLTIGKRIAIGFTLIMTLLVIIVGWSLYGIGEIVRDAEEAIFGNGLRGNFVQREVDHLLWVDKVNKLITDDSVHELKVQTDPKKCAFGKWYYSEERQLAEQRIPALKEVLAKLEKPHTELHQSAIKIKNTYRKADTKLPHFLAQKEVDHLRWAAKVIHDILDHEDDVHVQMDHTKCGFGKFIYGEVGQSIAKAGGPLAQLLNDIKKPHQELHSTAKSIRARVKNRDYDGALSVYQKQTLPKLDETTSILKKMATASLKDLEGLQAAKEIYTNETSQHLNLIRDLIHQVRDTIKNNIITDAHMLEEATLTKNVDTILSVISIIIGVFLAIFITRSIVKPLENIGSEISLSSDQVSSASSELSDASQKLAEASNTQASSLEETSASLEEISGMVDNNASNAEKSSVLSDEMKNYSEKGNESVDQLQNSMKEILEANDEIQKLVKVISEIGEKTKVIDEIVGQTKLLSFNASVEAERAGEHGRGFAVVAQEVGNLASMSGKAALEIASIVKESLKTSQEITSNSKAKVETGHQIVLETAEILKQINEKALNVSQNANQIVQASKEQASGIRQINGAVTQLDESTQNNAAISEEAASSSEELAAQAESLQGLVSDLQKMLRG